MEQKNYQATITTDVPAHEAFAKIADVAGWWAKDFKGQARNVGDSFTVQFGDTKVDFEISEAIPDEKIVWSVTDCYLPWLKDKTEWTGTKVAWELTPENGGTRIDMTHIGLVPGIECYEACNAGWNRHIIGSLHKLLSEGLGQPQ